MKKDIQVYLEDILECVGKIEAYTRDLTFTEFEKNTEHQDAVMRRLEIIGEAVKHLPQEIKEIYPQLPWKQIAGMRDVLIHEYAGVVLERVWKAATDDLGSLKTVVQKILKDLKN